MLRPEEINDSSASPIGQMHPEDVRTLRYRASQGEIARWGWTDFYEAMPADLADFSGQVVLQNELNKPSDLPSNFEYPGV